MATNIEYNLLKTWVICILKYNEDQYDSLVAKYWLWKDGIEHAIIKNPNQHFLGVLQIWCFWYPEPGKTLKHMMLLLFLTLSELQHFDFKNVWFIDNSLLWTILAVNKIIPVLKYWA